MTKTELIFKKNIIALREKTGLKPYPFALAVGLEPASYYKLENLKISRQPKFETLEKIASIHQIPVHQLFIPNFFIT